MISLKTVATATFSAPSLPPAVVVLLLRRAATATPEVLQRPHVNQDEYLRGQRRLEEAAHSALGF